jgi:hypothetical protein
MIPAKKTKKEEAQPLAAVDASTRSSSSKPIIEENSPIVKAAQASSDKPTKKKTVKMPKNVGGLTMDSTVPNLSIKIYEEQLPEGLEKFFERVRVIDKGEYWVFAIVHDRDLVGDEIFEPAVVKPHLHIIVVKKGKDQYGRAERRKVSTILSMLGIVFRPEEDASLWANRGVERVKHLDNAVAYLTHETPDCERDGKELYDRAAIVSNLEPDEIDQLRDGYVRITHSKHKATIDEQIELGDAAENAGRTGSMTWRQFQPTLPFVLQKGSAKKYYLERYQQGVDDRMAEHSEVLRLCVFIQGEANQGKTYAAKHAFDGSGLRIFELGDGGKTGKFDDLNEDVDVLVVDDAVISDVLGMADNKVCKVYRRNGYNPYWCGARLIITSNLSFEDWAKRCGIDSYTMEAAKSRFYICQVIDDGNKKFLDCSQVSKRGTPEQQRRRLDMFLSFRDKFDALIGSYMPDDEPVDYSAVLGPSAAPVVAPRDETPKCWFGSTVNENGQLKLPEDPSDCLPF